MREPASNLRVFRPCGVRAIDVGESGRIVSLRRENQSAVPVDGITLGAEPDRQINLGERLIKIADTVERARNVDGVAVFAAAPRLSKLMRHQLAFLKGE